MNIYVIYHKITEERLSQLIMSKNDGAVLFGFREFIKNMKAFSPKTIILNRIGYFDETSCEIVPEKDCFYTICDGESVEKLIAEMESKE